LDAVRFAGRAAARVVVREAVRVAGREAARVVVRAVAGRTVVR
jgi:hypothetical protein